MEEQGTETAQPTPVKEEVVGGTQVVVNKKEMDWTEEERERIQHAMTTKKPQDMVCLSGERSEKKKLTKEHVKPDSTVYFKDCHASEYILAAPCTKVMIEGCHQCKIFLNAQIKTEVVEIWKCDSATLMINSAVKTLQADLSKDLAFRYARKESFSQIIWGGVYGLAVSFLDSEDSLQSGFEHMKEAYPDINDQTDQFIVRFVEGKLLTEQVVRLKNGFPTTEREAKEFDEKQAKEEQEREEYMRKLVKFAAPKLGIKNDKKRPKVGRNEPCPCGSQKKFKGCCWANYDD